MSSAAPPEIESVICVVPSRRLTCQGSADGLIANWARLSRTCWYCSSGRVLPWLIVLWRSRPVVHPVTQAKPMVKMILATRMRSPGVPVRMVYADYIGKWWPGRENRGHSNLAIGHPLLPIVTPQRTRRQAQTVCGRVNSR